MVENIHTYIHTHIHTIFILVPKRLFREYMLRDKNKVKLKIIYYLQKQCNQVYMISYIIRLRCTVHEVF